jgi:hypothetical protein
VRTLPKLTQGHLKSGVLSGMILLQSTKKMSTRDLTKELSYWVYNDPEYGDDITNLDYPSLISLLTELVDRIEQLEKDNQILKSYAWEQ